jgi:hypothetical protein
MMRTSRHRTQISLEGWQYQVLLEVAKRERKTLSQIVREVLSEKLFSKCVQRVDQDPIWGIIGIGSGDGSPVAREHDRYLYHLESKYRKRKKK